MVLLVSVTRIELGLANHNSCVLHLAASSCRVYCDKTPNIADNADAGRARGTRAQQPSLGWVRFMGLTRNTWRMWQLQTPTHTYWNTRVYCVITDGWMEGSSLVTQQNHRLAGVKDHPWAGTPSSMPGCSTHNFYGQPVVVPNHPHGK